ncbi:hypothetical protein HELRODRAFT_158428 [Helobdella robusta]|uniref:Uncharacterized protein n=1 Tax=Helobdella robusta TaxID=6412 RepID=T1EMS0_HELRO|nr:hypothetical protein HELRODRAFT_158428 [Helobdella robusta]ESO12025.1 hypothetical protein HELRODRAFT_158428 [Helobdella robusta]
MNLTASHKDKILKETEVKIIPFTNKKQERINTIKFQPITELFISLAHDQPFLTLSDTIWAAGWVIKAHDPQNFNILTHVTTRDARDSGFSNPAGAGFKIQKPAGAGAGFTILHTRLNPAINPATDKKAGFWPEPGPNFGASLVTTHHYAHIG